MSWYTEHILPRGVDFMMSRPNVNDERPRCTKGLSGRVLEVGFGSGLNLPFYPPEVTEVLALEPAKLAHKLAAKRVAASPIPVQFIGLRGEEIPLDAGSVDFVACTWTLCTIPDVAAALGEIKRVLRDEGKFHFLEHGHSRDERVAKWQKRLNGLQKLYAGGCHLDRRIDELVQAAGFELEELEEFTVKGPKVASYMYSGVAAKAE